MEIKGDAAFGNGRETDFLIDPHQFMIDTEQKKEQLAINAKTRRNETHSRQRARSDSSSEHTAMAGELARRRSVVMNKYKRLAMLL